jgi:hypothetical protein
LGSKLKRKTKKYLREEDRKEKSFNTLKEEKFTENEIPFSSLLLSNPSNFEILGVSKSTFFFMT